jgi:L-aminopeptidase/D-esterase-like protein
MNTGPTNSLCDVEGLAVGHATDHAIRSGVTVVIADRPAVASVHVMGGAPGTRDTDLLAPEQTVEQVDALVLSGGSAFGLDAAGGVMAWLAAAGRGFAVGPARVPIVPGAILFDLLNGGEKPWLDGRVRFAPYRDLGFAAAEAASRGPFALGSVGAGCGATTATLKGGLGTASSLLPDGTTVAALVAVNALGTATIGSTGHFWAAPFEHDGEFGGLGWPNPWPADATLPRIKGHAPDQPLGATTIAIVATDAALTKAQAKRLAVMAHDGIARALYPAHTPFDGDLVFTIATDRRPAPAPSMMALGISAANTLARAIPRGVHAATPQPGDPVPTWRERFGRQPA